MKPKKLTQLITTGILITFITILQPFLTLALTSTEIGEIATQITVRITGADNGSGIIISKNGNTYTVLTNSHVFENRGNYQVTTSDEKKYQVTNIKKIENLDLATFEFNSGQEYQVVKQGDSKQMKIGKSIYVSGFPANKGLNFLPGTVSRIEEPQDGGYTLVYRIGAFPGMSGGPILNEDGKLVGIHGLTKSIFLGLGRSTPEEYGIPLQTFLNASSISRSSLTPIPSSQPNPSPTPTFRPSQTPPPPSPSLTPSPSHTPTRYIKLESLLKAQDLKEADLETDRIMLAAANRERWGWLRVRDTVNFPCKELRTIDNLWLKYSQGKFGFSVQQEIYKNLGGTKEFNKKLWESFGDRVGWRRSDSWINYSNLNFSLSAEPGQFPFPSYTKFALSPLFDSFLYRLDGQFRGWARTSLLSRYVECKA